MNTVIPGVQRALFPAGSHACGTWKPCPGPPVREFVARLTYEMIYHWRSELDRLLTAAATQDPALWQRARTPGTWLDSLLRLRSVLTHVISKAYWSAHTEISYADIEIERYLWGAR